jgi:hypothetical protein
MQIATATQSDRRDKDVRHTAVVGMLDNAFATKRFTRNAAQQAVKQINIVSIFRFLKAKCSLQCSEKS